MRLGTPSAYPFAILGSALLGISGCGGDDDPGAGDGSVDAAATDAAPGDAAPGGDGAPADAAADAGDGNGSEGDGNWALLEGAQIADPGGEGTRKELSVSAEDDPEERFSFGTPYLLRFDSGSTSAAFVMSVENTGDEPRCSIEVELSLRSGSDAELVGAQELLSGSASFLNTVQLTRSTCLQAGEEGYITASYDLSFDDAEGVELAIGSSEFGEPASGEALPFDYSVNGADLSLDVQNDTSTDVVIQSAELLVFDDTDAPIGRIELEFDPAQSLDARSEVTIDTTLADELIEAGSTVWAQTDFERASSSATGR